MLSGSWREHCCSCIWVCVFKKCFLFSVVAGYCNVVFLVRLDLLFDQDKVSHPWHCWLLEWVILFYRGCPVTCRMFSKITGLYRLEAPGTPFPKSWQHSTHCQMLITTGLDCNDLSNYLDITFGGKQNSQFCEFVVTYPKNVTVKELLVRGIFFDKFK